MSALSRSYLSHLPVASPSRGIERSVSFFPSKKSFKDSILRVPLHFYISDNFCVLLISSCLTIHISPQNAVKGLFVNWLRQCETSSRLIQEFPRLLGENFFQALKNHLFTQFIKSSTVPSSIAGPRVQLWTLCPETKYYLDFRLQSLVTGNK